jgi:hypothetical protein
MDERHINVNNIQTDWLRVAMQTAVDALNDILSSSNDSEDCMYFRSIAGDALDDIHDMEDPD